MLVPMRRVDIVLPRSSAGQALRLIHRAGVVHLASFRAPEDVSPGAFASPRGGAGGAPTGGHGQHITAALEEVAGLGTLLRAATVERARLEATWALDDRSLLEAVVALRPVQARADQLTGERVRLTADLGRLDGYRRLIDSLAGAVGRLPRVRGYAATGIIVASRHGPIIGLISEQLEATTGGRCEVIAADLPDDRSAAILLYPARMAAEVSALLGGRDLEEVSLPSDLQGVPFDELGPRMAAEAERLKVRIGDLDAELGRLSDEHAAAVAALRLVLEDRMAETRELERATRSEHLVMLSGWVPSMQLETLRAALDEGLGQRLVLIDHGGTRATDEEVPVAMANGPLSRAFGPLARFVAVPRYGTIDPTPLLALTFPAFVGLMVGDAGYGLVLLGLLLLFRRRLTRSSRLRAIWPVGLTMALTMVVFGLLFGELFGETGRHALGIEPIWFDRREAVLALLVVALTIGVAHVSLGLALGVVNAALVRRRREAVGRVALLVGLLTVIVLAGAAAGLLPSELAVMASAALVAALVICFLAMGLAGPIEMLGVLGNVLSYARLMAIALAGVMLALIADRMGSLVPNVVFGLLVAILLHALNLVLGVFDASVQGLRLHYVEFFTKFVEPGGTPYAPFTSVLGAPARASQRTGG